MSKQPDLSAIIAAIQANQASQAPADPAQTAITLQGINKYWPQIVAAVALGWFLVGQGKEQERLMGRVAIIEKAQEDLTKVKADQIKTSGEVKDLQTAVNSIATSQTELSKKFDAMSNDVRAVGQQLSSISQAMRQR